MPWRLARITDDLTDDPAWHGELVGSGTGPPASIFFPVGTVLGAQVHDNQWVSIRIGFIDALGNPVAGQGTCTAAPMTADDLPFPGQSPGQTQKTVSVEDDVADIAAWRPWSMPIQPRGLWSVRLTGMALVGATRVAVWYWAAQ